MLFAREVDVNDTISTVKIKLWWVSGVAIKKNMGGAQVISLT